MFAARKSAPPPDAACLEKQNYIDWDWSIQTKLDGIATKLGQIIYKLYETEL